MYPNLKSLGPYSIVGGSSSRTVITFPVTKVVGFVGSTAIEALYKLLLCRTNMEILIKNPVNSFLISKKLY